MLSAEVSAGAHQRRHQGPEVDAQGEPAGRHLRPHGRHGALHDLVVGVGTDEPEKPKSETRCLGGRRFSPRGGEAKKNLILTGTSW